MDLHQTSADKIRIRQAGTLDDSMGFSELFTTTTRSIFLSCEKNNTSSKYPAGNTHLLCHIDHHQYNILTSIRYTHT